MPKCPTTKTMTSMDRVVEAIMIYREQYNDGLLARGEAVNGMMAKLVELRGRDLLECRRVVQTYGLDGNDFRDFCYDEDNKEEDEEGLSLEEQDELVGA